MAIYVDDVYRPASGGLSFQLFDLERIEVLRGPQGTLFGRNTTGGLVHFISKRPTDQLDGYIDVAFGEYNQIKAEGAIGGPLTDSLSGRLSAAMDKYDGFTENRFPGGQDYNEGDSRAIRGQLQFEPGEAARILVSGNYAKNDAAVGAWQHQATTLGGPNGDTSVPLGPDEQSDTVNCDPSTPGGDFRPRTRHRLLRLPRHRRRSVGRRLRSQGQGRDGGRRRDHQRRVADGRRDLHVDHGVSEGSSVSRRRTRKRARRR